MIVRILRTVLPIFLVAATIQTAGAADPSDIYQAIIDLHHRALLEKIGGTERAKKNSRPSAPAIPKSAPQGRKKKVPSRRLLAVYGNRALIRIDGQDVLVRKGSRIESSGQTFRVAEIRLRSVVLIPGNRAVRFLRRTGPAGLFRFRGRKVVRGVGDRVGRWRVVELGMNHALLENGSETKRLVPGEKPRPRPALILSFSGASSGSLASTDFPKVPFSVREVHGRHALLSFGSENVEAGIGSTFGRWKIAGIDPSSGVDVLDRLTGNHIMMGGAGEAVPGGIPGTSNPPSSLGTGIANPGAFSPGGPGSGIPGSPAGPGNFPFAPPLPGGTAPGSLPGGLRFPGGGSPGNTGPFAQPPGGPQLPYNGY